MILDVALGLIALCPGIAGALPVELVLETESSIVPAGGTPAAMSGSFLVGLRPECVGGTPPTLSRPGDLVLGFYDLAGGGFAIHGGSLGLLCPLRLGDLPTVPTLSLVGFETLDPGEHDSRSRKLKLEYDPQAAEPFLVISNDDGSLSSISLSLLLAEEVWASDLLPLDDPRGIAIGVSTLESRQVLANLHIIAVALPEPGPFSLIAMSVLLFRVRRSRRSPVAG